MPLPSRPVANTTIDSEWGQAVHDWTFAPKGCDLSGTTRTVSTTAGGLSLNISVANDDPGGWLDTNAAVCPTDGAGLYLVILVVNSVNGTAGDQTRAYIYLNGVSYATAIEDNAGGTNITVTVPALIPLTAGDVVSARAQKKGSGTDPTVQCKSLRIVALGFEYGA